MRYTHIAMAGRHRVLFNGPDDSRFVTTVGSADDAKAIASALDVLLADLPNSIDWDLMGLLDLRDDLDPDNGVHTREPHGFDVGWDPHYWERSQLEPGKVTATNVVRRTLSWLSEQAGDPPIGWNLKQLADALNAQPESVVRAVRDEVATALRSYDTVPVLGVVYDRKWDEVRTSVCLNAGLEMLTTEQLDELTDGHFPDNIALNILGLLENAGHGDFRYAEKVADQGYLEVAVHQQLLAAWRAATGR